MGVISIKGIIVVGGYWRVHRKKVSVMNCSEMKMSVGQMTAEKGKNQERDTDQEKKKKEVERDMLVRGILEGNIPGEDMIEKDIVEEEIWGKKRWDRMTEEKYQ